MRNIRISESPVPVPGGKKSGPWKFEIHGTISIQTGIVNYPPLINLTV